MKLLLTIVLCLLPFVFSCENPDPVEKLENRVISSEESRLVELYIKISELSKNLKDNNEEVRDRILELKSEIDPDEIKRIIDETNSEPERWLAIFKRMYKLQRLQEEK